MEPANITNQVILIQYVTCLHNTKVQRKKRGVNIFSVILVIYENDNFYFYMQGDTFPNNECFYWKLDHCDKNKRL